MNPTENTDDAPLLMIEGDEFFVNKDGVCRTFYELERWNNGDLQSLSLEEEYDLQTAHKIFNLRCKSPSTQHCLKPVDSDTKKTTNGHHDKYKSTPTSPHKVGLPPSAQGVVNIGALYRRVHIQEIDQGVFGSAGTGATTWESSIAMAMLFSSQPHLLQGHVLELGSGVGLGGILTGLMVMPSASVLSLTLTDGNQQVLEACYENCRRAKLDFPNFHVQRLDWNAMPKSSAQYDSVLASDCAYKYPDIVALAAACKDSLKKPHGTLHIFGPYNRGCLHDLIRELKDRHGMDIEVNWLELNRYRLQSSRDTTLDNESGSQMDADEVKYASRHVVKFLHVSAMHGSQENQRVEGHHHLQSNKNGERRKPSRMDSID